MSANLPSTKRLENSSGKLNIKFKELCDYVYLLFCELINITARSLPKYPPSNLDHLKLTNFQMILLHLILLDHAHFLKNKITAWTPFKCYLRNLENVAT